MKLALQDILIGLAFLAALMLIALSSFGLLALSAGKALGDERPYEHSHMYAVRIDKNTVFVYNCVDTSRPNVITDTYTDGANTMYFVSGNCPEA